MLVIALPCNNAVIQSMGSHENIVMMVLSNEAVAEGFAELMFDVLMKGMGANKA